MLTYDNSTCQKKVEGCRIDSAVQPSGLIVDGEGWWQCPECDYGFYFVEGNASTPSKCERCEASLSGCTRCTNTKHCIECKEGWYLNVDGTQCLQEIDFCLTDHSEYRPFFPRCKECVVGYFPLNETCAPCSNGVKGCEECDLNTFTNTPYCTSCSALNEIPSDDGLKCVSILANCKTDPEDYKVDKDGDYVCPHCKNNMTWVVSYDKTLKITVKGCENCSEAIENCEVCDFHGYCAQCKNTHFVDYHRDRCVTKFTNCEDKEAFEHKHDTTTDRLICDSCKEGYYFNTSDKIWNCD